MDKPRELPAAPILTSIVPVGALPGRLRAAVFRVLKEWGYSWEDVTFAGTAVLPPGGWHLAPGSDEAWVLAITAASLTVGDELDSAGGRGAGIGLSAFSGGVIPVAPATPHQALVYEYLGRRGGGLRDEPQPPAAPSTTSDMEPVGPDQHG